jgi:hypothetical protein
MAGGSGGNLMLSLQTVRNCMLIITCKLLSLNRMVSPPTRLTHKLTQKVSSSYSKQIREVPIAMPLLVAAVVAKLLRLVNRGYGIFLELFAGCGNLTTAVQKAGMVSFCGVYFFFLQQ